MDFLDILPLAMLGGNLLRQRWRIGKRNPWRRCNDDNRELAVNVKTSER